MSQVTSRATQIPFVDLRSLHEPLAAEILSAWQRILAGAGFVGGPEVDGFEKELAAYVGTSHAVAVNSGTDAIRFALLAMGLKPGDEVLTVPHTFIATTEAITQAGGQPVFVDVDEATGTMDPALVEAAIGPRTRFLLPVHLYGQPADMDPLLEIAGRRGLTVLEDACQAHGARYRGRNAGTMGRAAAFSFYPGKNLGACGEGGAVTTDDPEIATLVKRLRDHGQTASTTTRPRGTTVASTRCSAPRSGSSCVTWTRGTTLAEPPRAVIRVASRDPRSRSPARCPAGSTSTTSTSSVTTSGIASRPISPPRGSGPGFTIPSRFTSRRPMLASASDPGRSPARSAGPRVGCRFPCSPA